MVTACFSTGADGGKVVPGGTASGGMVVAVLAAVTVMVWRVVSVSQVVRSSCVRTAVVGGVFGELLVVVLVAGDEASWLLVVTSYKLESGLK